MGNPKGFPHLHVYKPFGFVHYIMGEYTPTNPEGFVGFLTGLKPLRYPSSRKVSNSTIGTELLGNRWFSQMIGNCFSVPQASKSPQELKKVPSRVDLWVMSLWGQKP